jgi:hypothetical protein
MGKIRRNKAVKRKRKKEGGKERERKRKVWRPYATLFYFFLFFPYTIHYRGRERGE